MNERIRQLTEQASEWYEQNFSGKGIPGEWETKFAELIVQECVNIAYKEGDNVAYLALYFGRKENE